MATKAKGRKDGKPTRGAKPARSAKPTDAKPARTAKPAAKPTRTAAASAARALARRTRTGRLAGTRRPAEVPPDVPQVVARRPRHAQLKLSAEHADVALFAPLTEGERADALRVLLEDDRLREMGKVGRYRVVSVEPIVMKPPEPFAGRRIARIIIFDYAHGQTVDASVDLDTGVVCLLNRTGGQPFLAAEEETLARQVAAADPRVAELAGADATPQAVMHYWSRKPAELAYHRRTAAVLIGPVGGRATVVALVDLVNASVTDVVLAAQW